MIIGRTELVLSGAYGDLGPDPRRSLEVVLRHAERLTAELAALAEALAAAADPPIGP